MCLFASKIHTEKLQAKSGTLKVYKVYITQLGKKVLLSPYQSTTRKGGVVKGVGDIVSNRPNSKVAWSTPYGEDSTAQGEIEKGIHVYLKRDDADSEATAHENSVVVQLEADYADLIGVEHKEDGSHAAFMKVRLTDAAWLTAFPLTDAEKAVKRSEASRKAAATKKRKAAGRSAAARKAAVTRALNRAKGM